LPSRQKSTKATTKVDLHAHVLELFTALAFDDTPEFEDSITDLLYFVVDILQFNGEPNAYDEIDFDALLVDTLDALRAFHAAYDLGNQSRATRHNILVLDKEVEMFPWESLPCLEGRPVSRMPSLGAIKQRLDALRQQSAEADCLAIPARGGAYILNPSSDLRSTQDAFETTLATQLPTFDGLVNVTPTSTQFEDYLTSKPLLLYFGHGSGAQYVLKRRIRAMRNCSLTWLMGCSSLTMTECGVFESHGMPNVYIHGGSPAVVGTLWDVTDRDLDRFAMRGLSLWGLVEEPPDEVDKSKGKKAATAKINGKGKAAKESSASGRAGKWSGTSKEERRGQVALDEAVSEAKKACRLRYLNGAAVVVYGVPVVLQ
jgi:separase